MRAALCEPTRSGRMGTVWNAERPSTEGLPFCSGLAAKVWGVSGFELPAEVPRELTPGQCDQPIVCRLRFLAAQICQRTVPAINAPGIPQPDEPLTPGVLENIIHGIPSQTADQNIIAITPTTVPGMSVVSVIRSSPFPA